MRVKGQFLIPGAMDKLVTATCSPHFCELVVWELVESQQSQSLTGGFLVSPAFNTIVKGSAYIPVMNVCHKKASL